MKEKKKSQQVGSILERIGYSEIFWGYVFLAPTIIGLALFTAGPVIGVFSMSFTSWDMLSPPKWTGFANYVDLTRTPLFWKSLINTLYYTAGTVPIGVGLSLALAILLNRKLKGIIFFRTIYFLPVVSSMVAVGVIWSWLYNAQFGLINWILMKFGLSPVSWLSSTEWAMPAVIIMSIWKLLGFYAVLFLAGLQAIPNQYYEAARIDGANWWHNFRHITLPLLSPMTLFVLIMSFIYSFQVFEQTYILSYGGPANATLTTVYYLFLNAFSWFKMGYAAAVGFVLFIFIFLITMLQLRLQSRWVHYY